MRGPDSFLARESCCLQRDIDRPRSAPALRSLELFARDVLPCLHEHESSQDGGALRTTLA
jgi:hypothetical protein